MAFKARTCFRLATLGSIQKNLDSSKGDGTNIVYLYEALKNIASALWGHHGYRVQTEKGDLILPRLASYASLYCYLSPHVNTKVDISLLICMSLYRSGVDEDVHCQQLAPSDLLTSANISVHTSHSLAQ